MNQPIEITDDMILEENTGLYGQGSQTVVYHEVGDEIVYAKTFDNFDDAFDYFDQFDIED